MEQNSGLYAIGDLSRLTGLSAYVIRAWELRYGFPKPLRLESGHRRYTQKTIDRLRLIVGVVAAGVKISKAVNLSDEELCELSVVDLSLQDKQESDFDDLLPYLLEFDGKKIEDLLEGNFKNKILNKYLDDYLGPLITNIGIAWAQGKINVRHEHFFSEVLTEFINRHKRRDFIGKRKGILATLEGEKHELGLKMLDWCLTEEEIKTYYLGTSNPSNEIFQSAQDLDIEFLFLSVSAHSSSQNTFDQIKTLRNILPNETSIIVGGSGVLGRKRFPKGVKRIASFSTLIGMLNEK